MRTHSYHAPTRRVLQELLPDVDAALWAAGAIESPPTDRMPPILTDRSPRSGDGGLATVLARRSTLNWVLACCAPAHSNAPPTGEKTWPESSFRRN